MEGYIKLSRRLLSSDIWFKPPLYLKVWIYLLCQASHQDYGTLRRGQLVTSIPQIQEELSYKEGAITRKPSYEEIRSVIRYMRKKPTKSTLPTRCPHRDPRRDPEEKPMISTRKITGGLLVTIEKYSEYQDTISSEDTKPREPHRDPHRDGYAAQIFIDNKKDNKKDHKKYPNTLSVNSTRSGADFGSVENWKDKPKTPEDFWNTGRKQ